MNFKPNQIPIFLFGAAIGAILGFTIAFIIPASFIPESYRAASPRGICTCFGLVLGLAVATLILIVRDSRNANTDTVSNFSNINGTGSAFIGRKEIREDGSYLTTEWFVILAIPIFPVCRYRLVKNPGFIPPLAKIHHPRKTTGQAIRGPSRILNYNYTSCNHCRRNSVVEKTNCITLPERDH